MNKVFKQNFNQSASNFSLVKDTIEYLIGGNIYSLELDSNNIDSRDIQYGYDLIQTIDNNEYGIASRIQPSNRPWNTFTIRYSLESGMDTEYLKRIINIASEDLYPKWTIQAYVSIDNTKLLSLGIIDTKIFYNKVASFIRNNELGTDRNKDVYITTNTIDNNEFLVVRWRLLVPDLKIATFVTNHKCE